MTVARVDDTGSGGHGMSFGKPVRTLTALQSSDVIGLLAEAERAAADGSWVVGYVAYEAASALDPSLATTVRRPSDDRPLAWFGLFAEAHEEPPLARRPPDRGRPYSIGPWKLDCDLAAYRSKVERIHSYIAAGDTYQTNLTVRLTADMSGDAFELYRDLALAQECAYGAYLDTGRFVIASASPELFFEWSEEKITTRPMKGTIARASSATDDAERAQLLVGSQKDRAENVMIVDLLRNDLGRLAEFGTVQVDDLFRLERYPTVWQLTSTVSARPRAGTGLVDVFRALFPSGSVTGAPKPRTMEIISEVEDSPRDVYCGAIGVLAPPGSSFRARFSVAIRTAVIDRSISQFTYGTGGGITWDSDALSEHAELVAKAAILEGPGDDFSLLETMAYLPESGIRNGLLHLQRLEASASYFGFPFDRRTIEGSLIEATEGVVEPCRVRITLGRDGTSEVVTSSMPLEPIGPVVLVVDEEPVDSSQIFQHHKTTRRTVYESRIARHPEVDDVVMINERGEITETTIANLAVLWRGHWVTPPLSVGCLPGVERSRLVASGELSEKVLRIEDLSCCEDVAVISSLRGWRPAVVQGSTPLIGSPNRSASVG